mmetsp:Transcript_18268/g.24391  ORF Transcript_18268/g.24391 Transcript_18268/m.24391 type:complete len:138 (+) Transcript_18268:309-722(+)
MVVTFAICNLFLLDTNGHHVNCIAHNGLDKVAAIDQCFDNAIDSWYSSIASALFYGQGLIMLIVRMLEPGSLKVHIALLKRLLTCKDDEGDCVDLTPPEISRVYFGCCLIFLVKIPKLGKPPKGTDSREITSNYSPE